MCVELEKTNIEVDYELSNDFSTILSLVIVQKSSPKNLSAGWLPTGYRQVKKKEKLCNLQSKTNTLETISYVSIHTVTFKSFNATRPLMVCHVCINDVYLVHLCCLHRSGIYMKYIWNYKFIYMKFYIVLYFAFLINDTTVNFFTRYVKYVLLVQDFLFIWLLLKELFVCKTK